MLPLKQKQYIIRETKKIIGEQKRWTEPPVAVTVSPATKA